MKKEWIVAAMCSRLPWGGRPRGFVGVRLSIGSGDVTDVHATVV